MIRKGALCIAVLLALSLAGCKTKEESNVRDNNISQESEKTNDNEKENVLETNPISTDKYESNNIDGENSNSASSILIVYFSIPEDVDISGVDAVAGASVVVKDNERVGNTEYVAKIIQQTIGGDLFRIETEEEYPLDHTELVDYAEEEQYDGKRPKLKTHIENFEQYETIIIGYPNWWADLPMPVYSFLEEYDFETKTIIPFVTHGGSGFSRTIRTISNLQPDAYVSENTLSISRGNVAKSQEEVIEWAKSLELTTE